MSGPAGFATPDWDELASRHREETVREVRAGFEGGGNPTFTPRGVLALHPDEAEALLGELATRRGGGPWLRYEPRYRCALCGGILSRADCDQQICPDTGCPTNVDGEPWEDEDEEPAWRLIDPEPVRRAGWLLALHGMNTRGPWQEAFNWLVARSYGQMVPVAVYKYGKVRPGAFVKLLQRRHRDRLAARLRRYRTQAEVAGFRRPPDVIAHSFGTWLLAHALLADVRSPGKPPLQVGRVILTGSIVRPDFPWHELLEAEPPRLEAVLNHHGSRDLWALLAHWAIPRSGPSGRRGFNGGSPEVLNLEAPGFTHSQFFREDEMPALFAGPWSQFLSRPIDRVKVRLQTGDPDEAWKPAPWLLQARLARWLLLGLAAAALLLLIAAVLLGAAEAIERPLRAAAVAGGVAGGGLALWLLGRLFEKLGRLAPWPW